MSSLSSIIETFKVYSEKHKKFTDADLCKLLCNYYTSSDVVNHYQQAIRQLDTEPLNESYQWLLFTGFRSLTSSFFYTDELRDKLCQFWLPKYEYMLKELLPHPANDIQDKYPNHLRLNAIKYLITNMITNQRTIESSIHLLKTYGQFQNFSQKDQYLSIIKLISSLLINEHFLEGVKNDDYTNIKFKWNGNDPSNTINVKPTIVLWIILKLIIHFIKTDENCLIDIKYNTNIKEILLKSMRQIEDNHPIKTSAYAVLTLLINENDIKNEINNPNQIISVLVDNVDQSSRFLCNGVYIIDLMIALKAFLQHDQVQNGFIENEYLGALMDNASGILEFPHPLNPFIDFEAEVKLQLQIDSEYQQELEADPKISEIYTQIKENFKIDAQEFTKHIGLLALECLFLMSFNKKASEIIKKREDFMSEIRKFANDNNLIKTNGRLKKVIDGLLWKLENEDKFKKQQKTTAIKKDNEFDLMISYSWHDKSLIHDIYKYLTQQFNYRVWLDENQMTGSLCQAMAKAVEKSKIILMFERDGWLGFISAGKIDIDFIKNDFQEAIHLLKVEIERYEYNEEKNIPKIKTNEINSSVAAPIPETTKLLVRPAVISKDYKKIALELWSEQHVQDFLYDNKLDMMILLTENMNGEQLYLLLEKCLRDQDCWTT
ncbi:unnamed protein product, partial [Rotaria sp. Silwood1]